MDERIKVFAHNLIHKSIQVKSGDKVYIDYTGESTEALARQLIKETYAAGAMPFPHYTNPRVQREMLLHCNEEQLRLMAQVAAAEMAQMDCYLAIRGADNIWPSMNVFTAHQFTMKSVYRSCAGVLCVIRTTRWLSSIIRVWKRLRTFILTSAASTMKKWAKP